MERHPFLLALVALASACGSRSALGVDFDGGVDSALDAAAADAEDDGGPDARLRDAGDDAFAFDGGGTDADSDGGPDGSIPTVGQTAARFPWNGFATGSVWDDGRARRPSFQWTPVADADHYELRLDDSCTPGACEFSDPRVFVFEESRVELPEALPVRLTAPVGRRYYWGVRACRVVGDGEELCSEWTATRYLDVGKQKSDYDGDGFADLAFATPEVDHADGRRGAVYVFPGSPLTGAEAPAPITIIPPTFGGDRPRSPTNVGDLNGDGFADMAAFGSTPASDGLVRESALFIYYGSAMGLSLEPSLVVQPPPSCQLEWSAVGPGDLDGDGFDDLAVGILAPATCAGARETGIAVHIYYGRAAGLSEAQGLSFTGPFSSFGRGFPRRLGGPGDVDGDGYVELVVAISDYIVHRPALVFTGSEGGLGEAPTYSIEAPARLLTRPVPRYTFGFAFPALGDTNGDGFAEIVAVRTQTFDDDPPGAMHIYEGGPYGPPFHASQDLDSEGERVFGEASTGGDFNGDGYGDLAFNAGTREDEHVRVHFGGPDGLSEEAERFVLAPAPERNLQLRISSPGDVDGNGFWDLVVAAPVGVLGPGSAQLWRSGERGFGRPDEIRSPTDQRRAFFGAQVADASN